MKPDALVEASYTEVSTDVYSSIFKYKIIVQENSAVQMLLLCEN